MLFRYLETLRKKPLDERRRAAVTLTIQVVIVIGVLALILGSLRSFIVERVTEEIKTPEFNNGIQAPY